MDWDGLRVLLEVARAGSFLRAGEALGLATSTVSRRISALEASLGAQLVERATDGCHLTARGARVAEMARGFSRELVEVRQDMSDQLRGTIAISCSDGFISLVTAAASEFAGSHPECVVAVDVANDYAQVSRGEADVAIRLAHLGEPSLIYRRLVRMAYGYFGAAELLARWPEGLGDPSAVPFVSVLPPLDRSPQARAAMAAGFVHVQLKTSSFAAQLDAVRAGLGVAALPRIAADEFVEVFADLELPGVDVFLVTRPAAARQPHVRAFIDALVEIVEASFTARMREPTR